MTSSWSFILQPLSKAVTAKHRIGINKPLTTLRFRLPQKQHNSTQSGCHYHNSIRRRYSTFCLTAKQIEVQVLSQVHSKIWLNHIINTCRPISVFPSNSYTFSSVRIMHTIIGPNVKIRVLDCVVRVPHPTHPP